MRTYSEKLRDPRWQRKRLEIFSRDNFMCCDCGSTSRELQVHHCFYDNGNPWETADSLLITVCDPCHEERQAMEKTVRRSVSMALAKLPKVELAKLCDSAGKTEDDHAEDVLAAVAYAIACRNWERRGNR